jgi:hypothetical protein
VKLRDHPLLKSSGLPIWPPVWVSADTKTNRVISGSEIGALKRVERRSPIEKNIFLYIEHEQCEYMGHLTVDDETFCERLFNLLKNCRGCTIQEIGSMDIRRMPTTRVKTGG